ncbi:proton-coupled amino acid transporter-like protein pathetic [Coccinella septempunctata]|uniref:proton-coupled amino acid transporter-like protein pathetic n=1 Tax=Coccinella septempunctata TaxID=41139 RepID=UPI001D08EB79|nr:proton-coupled amino acid transporter-like protein pathetic [Coccinella septempunctata]
METKESVNNPTELETFLPQDGTNTNGISTTKYKITKKNDLEAAVTEFDPFKARKLEHPVSNADTLMHLLKASLGTGILSMPAAFAASGLLLGIFATVGVAIICTHCSYILVICAHELYKKTGKTSMSFADVAEEACNRGPKWTRGLGAVARKFILISLFVTYFATCSCYTVLIAKNFNSVAIDYRGEAMNERLSIALLLVPLLFLSYVPNLKYLAPVSMVANVFMAVGLGITFYYLVNDIPPVESREMVVDLTKFPIFFSITVFAIEAIGVVMPLENNMKTPQSFVGICGVLNQGMSGVTLVYILIGFFGYLKFGPDVQGSVTLDLTPGEIPAQIVKILIGLAVFCTFGLQFYVCLDIAWNGIKDKCQKFETVANYGMRTILVIICVLLAVAVPAITPFVGLIGAFCFSILGLIVPVFIEVVVFWEKGFGKYNWKIVKNVIVIITGLLALIFGSKSAIDDIIAMYK